MTGPTIAALVVGAVLALGMGSSGLAPSFAALLGAGLVGRRIALAAYSLAVLGGAVAFGDRVAKTLGQAIAPSEAFEIRVTLVALVAIAAAMSAATLLRIPQSTSWVTVSAVIVVGLDHGRVETGVLWTRLLPAWIVLPLSSYALTYLALRPLFPLRARNLRAHEWLKRHRGVLRGLAIASACYVAFAIGSNNVANVVGPLAAARVLDPALGLFVVAPLFGLGALLARGPADTLAKAIVPLGALTAALSGLVVGSLLLTASLFGLPQSLVQLSTLSVLAISRVKEGAVELMPQKELARIGVMWLAAPALTAALTWAGLWLLRRL